MIKSLLDADENNTLQEATTSPEPIPETAEEPPMIESRPPFELPGDSRFFKESANAASEDAPATEPEMPITADDKPAPTFVIIEPEKATSRDSVAEPTFSLADDAVGRGSLTVETEPSATPELSETPVDYDRFDSPSGTLFKQETPAQPFGETIRQSGLAYTAAMVLFGAVVFMMLLGWFADLLLGSSPWGIVGGIVLGGIVGFVQFFRIASQIFKK